MIYKTLYECFAGPVCESTVKDGDSNLEGEGELLDISKPDGNVVQHPETGEDTQIAENVSHEKPTGIIDEDGDNQSGVEDGHPLPADSGDDTHPDSKETSEGPVECGPKDDEKPEKHLENKEETHEESAKGEFQMSSQNQAEEQVREVEVREPVQGDGGQGGEQTKLQQQDRSADSKEIKAAEQGQLEAREKKDDKLAHTQEETNASTESEQQETSEHQESQTAAEHVEKIGETSEVLNGSVLRKDLEVEHTVETPPSNQVEKPESQVEIVKSMENHVEKSAPSEITAVEQGLTQAGSLAGGPADDQVPLRPPGEMQEENKKLKQEIFVAKQQADAFRIRALSLEQEVGKLRARKIDNRSQGKCKLSNNRDLVLKETVWCVSGIVKHYNVRII